MGKSDHLTGQDSWLRQATRFRRWTCCGRDLVISVAAGKQDPMVSWENHGKTLGKWWFNGIYCDFPSGNLLHSWLENHHFLRLSPVQMAILNSYVELP